MYLRVLQAFLSQLPISPASASCQDAASDSDDEEGEETDRQTSTPVSSWPFVWPAPCSARSSGVGSHLSSASALFPVR